MMGVRRILRRIGWSQRGVAMAETLVALPVLGALVGGAIQMGLLFEAKATLNHAVLQAARAGMVENADKTAIRLGLMRGLLPLYSPEPTSQGIRKALACHATPDVLIHSCIQIVNPTREAFDDHEVVDIVSEEFSIPNDELHRHPKTAGASSGVNVQDANLLKVRVVYGAKMSVPLIGTLIAKSMLAGGDFENFERGLLAQNRLPIVASATVRMQSPAKINSFMLGRSDLQSGPLCTRVLPEVPLITDAVTQCFFDKVAGAAGATVNCAECLKSSRKRIPDPINCGQCILAVPDLASCLFASDEPRICKS